MDLLPVVKISCSDLLLLESCIPLDCLLFGERVEQTCTSWFILSSRYGLVHPDQVIEPYEDWMQKWSKARRVTWQEKVLQELLKLDEQEFELHAGLAYYDPILESGLVASGATVSIPTRGMTALGCYSYLKNMQ